MLSSLIELAKESDSEKRRELLGHVSALFIAGAERYTNEEKTLFNGVMRRLAELVEVGDRQALAEDLSKVDQTPHDLVMQLANDNIVIARYMLQYSDVLTQADLMHLAKTKSQGHLLAISKRDHLEARLTDVLLERGEQPVHHSVAENPGAELSNWGARFLIKLADKDETLRDNLLSRQDLTKNHFDKLIDQLPEDEGKKLRHLYASNEKLVEDLFHEASKVVAASTLDRKKSRINTKVDIRDIRNERKDLNKVFAEYAMSNRLLDLSFLLADLAEIDQKHVINVILRMEIDGIAILCKSLDVGETEFGNFCRARCGILKLQCSIADNWMADYRVLSKADAKRVVRFLKVRLKAMEHSETLKQAS
ncbi:DUF2336 domain-containing protein [Roseibium sp.]|uniref:DUF2336 domain-containing protein n=1 Tax=Roseibium sp. TaxID=1936156 RepID=UPI003A96CE14